MVYAGVILAVYPLLGGVASGPLLIVNMLVPLSLLSVREGTPRRAGRQLLAWLIGLALTMVVTVRVARSVSQADQTGGLWAAVCLGIGVSWSCAFWMVEWLGRQFVAQAKGTPNTPAPGETP